MNNKYLKWLATNPRKWSEGTIKKYESAVRAVSKDMISIGLIDKELYSMSLIEYEIALEKIIRNEFFINKNTTGNQMYSNGLKQYRSYLVFEEFNLDKDQYTEFIESEIQFNEKYTETEKKALVNARIGQGVFRQRLLETYGKCLITGVDDERFLIASHIKPWSVSDNHERLSVYNGLLLTPNFDKLFDAGFITFKNDGTLIVSDNISSENIKRLDIPYNQKFKLCDSAEFKHNMEYHRDVLFTK